MEFKLTEKETQAAKDFIKEHTHTEEFKAAGKMGFSTLGAQFTYHITPGGLGGCIVIECNHCKKFKDITDIDCW